MESTPRRMFLSDQANSGESSSREELIFDWNLQGPGQFPAGRKVMLDDETLRDGLQNPSVSDPSIEDKIKILHLMEALGIDTVNIGLPGAGPRAYADVEALAREIGRAKLKIRPNCAARTLETDIRPIAEISQKTGIAIEAATFLGSRDFAEDGNRDRGGDVFGKQSDSTAGGRLDSGSLGAYHREGGEICCRAGPAGDVCDRGHDSDGRGDGEALVHDGD